MPNFTTEDLLVYMYDEMESDQASGLEKAMESDWALQQKYRVLIEAQENLQRMPMRSPRTATITAIVRYAEKNLHLSN